jgi:hypothetical protein
MIYDRRSFEIVSKSDERGVRRYAVRGVDGARAGHSLVVGLHDVRAGATLALKA